MLAGLYLSLVGGREDQFKYEVGVQSLWIENAVVRHDLMVEIDTVFLAINFFQFVLSIDSRGRLVPRA